MTSVNGSLFFSAYDDTHGKELWWSNGTEAGTGMVKDINPGSNNSSPVHFIDVNGTAFFYAGSGSGSLELWKSDGTAASTTFVQNAFFGLTPGTSPVNYYQQTSVNLTGLLVFRGIDEAHGDELWVSDGTAENTRMVKDIDPSGYSNPWGFKELSDNVLFLADDGINGRSLWFSDGTADGTTMLKDFLPTINADPYIELFLVSNNLLFFTVEENELWKSDGTAAGTVLVKAFEEYITVSEITVFNGEILFRAEDAMHGYELWKSDGTGAGTTMYELGFYKALDKLFFVADDESHGSELWAFDYLRSTPSSHSIFLPAILTP